MERLVKDLLRQPSISQHYTDDEYESVSNAISSLSGLVPKFRSTLRVCFHCLPRHNGAYLRKMGVEQLFNQLMRPKLRTLISDVYKDVSYVLDDDEYSSAEYQDVVRKRFVKSWESLMDGYKVIHYTLSKLIITETLLPQDIFTEGNFRLIFGLALDVVLRPWERFIMSLKFSEVVKLLMGIIVFVSDISPQLGAIRFDRDLRSVTTYLSSQTAFGDIREKFTRLQQISTLLNLDSVSAHFFPSPRAVINPFILGGRCR